VTTTRIRGVALLVLGVPVAPGDVRRVQ